MMLIQAGPHDSLKGWDGWMTAGHCSRFDSPIGGMIGMVEPVDVVRDDPSEWAVAEQWHWVLAHHRPLPSGAVKGQLGLLRFSPERRAPVPCAAWDSNFDRRSHTAGLRRLCPPRVTARRRSGPLLTDGRWLWRLARARRATRAKGHRGPPEGGGRLDRASVHALSEILPRRRSQLAAKL
jgi:hypothetical protein